MAYTYEDFERAASEAGLMGQFSQYDLDLARAHPEAGLSILSLKKDYANAKTAEQRALINEAANQVRSSYANYTGGTDGSQYYSTGIAGTVGGTQVAATPQQQKIDQTIARIGSFAPFEYEAAPTYENKYESAQKKALDAVIERPDFAWSPETDPTWSSYKKSYLREGDRAQANALAQASAGTGGRASTAAITAASQAGDYYAAKLNDMIPTLYKEAFDRYLKDYDMRLSDLGAINSQEQLDYQKYLDQLGQYNKDRSQEYSEYQGEYGRLGDLLAALQGQDKTIYQRAMEQEATKHQLETEQAERERQARATALQEAYAAAELGDYSLLEALGITPNMEIINQMALAGAGKYTGAAAGSSTGSDVRAAGGVGLGDGSGNDGGTVDAAFKNVVLEAYPDGVVTNPDDWQALLSHYDEETLKAAGITYNPGTQGVGLPNAAYNMAARGILENWQNGKTQQAQQGIAAIWDVLNQVQRDNLRTTLTNAGAGALFAGTGEPPAGDVNTGKPTTAEGLGAKAKSIYETVMAETSHGGSMAAIQADVEKRIRDGYQDGSISEEEADYLLKLFGYN